MCSSDPHGSIRRASRARAANRPSSRTRYRFERGVDPQFVLPGLELCTQYILEWCGGEASDVFIAGELPPPNEPIAFDPGTVKKLGGIDVPQDEIRRILEALGFVVESELAYVVPPSWRHDVDGPRRPGGRSGAHVWAGWRRLRPSSAHRRRRRAGSVQSATPHPHRPPGAGRARLQRNRELSPSSPASRPKLFGGGDDARQLSNPIASDLDALRPSVLPSLLAAASRNAARG